MEDENTMVPETGTIDHTGPEWYQMEIPLDEIGRYIWADLKTTVQSAISIGYWLMYVRDRELFREEGYNSINEYAADQFGFHKSNTKRHIERCIRFSKGGCSPILDDRYKDFGKSQLQEMLDLDDEQLEQVTPDMTVQQIRAMKKPKEIPYVELPGQISITDFPGIEPEGAMAAADVPLEPERAAMQSCEISVEDLIPEPEPLPVESVATSQPEEDTEPTDMELLREMLEKKKALLDEMVKVNAVEELPPKLLRKKKILVAALAGMLCDLEMPEPEEPEQPELPLMKNNDQRKAWLRDYKSWGLWYADEHIGARYYKYDFDNGARLIAEVYTNHNEFRQDYESSYLHLVGGPEPEKHPSGAYGRWQRHETYSRYPDSETELVEFLKVLQKGR